MAREDVEQALRAMDDEEVRRRLGKGDFGALPSTDLTDQERVLVKDAAGDYPEVAGFSFDAFQLSIGGESADDKHKDWIEVLAMKSKFLLASNYARGS